MSVSEYDSNGLCWQRGRAFEDNLKALFIKKGYKVRPSTQEEDYKLHADFWAYSDTWSRWLSVDAKAMKRIQRNGELQDEFTYVEWKNTAGYAGWLLCGADVVAFERRDEVVLAVRHRLKDWCSEQVDRTKKVDSPHQSLYCSYSRKGREDEISMIRISDVPCAFKKVWTTDDREAPKHKLRAKRNL